MFELSPEFLTNTTIQAVAAKRANPRTIPCSDQQFEFEIEAASHPQSRLFWVADKENGHLVGVFGSSGLRQRR
jgi:hypothetical protein